MECGSNHKFGMIETIISEISSANGIKVEGWNEIKNRGVNNKVWQLTCQDGEKYALKLYNPIKKKGDLDRYKAILLKCLVRPLYWPVKT